MQSSASPAGKTQRAVGVPREELRKLGGERKARKGE